MKNILIYIDTSLGELDWVVPLIKSKDGKIFNFYILFNDMGLGRNDKDYLSIMDRYELNRVNVTCINDYSRVFKIYSFLENFLTLFKRALYKITKISGVIDKYTGRMRIYFLKSQHNGFDYIFRDAGLDDSLYLDYYLKTNCKAKVVVFPNGTGLTTRHPSCPQVLYRTVPVDLWLENSRFSNAATNNPAYKKVFFSPGSPSLSVNYKKSSLFDPYIKRVLVTTRNCKEEYGFDFESGYKAVDQVLQKLENMGYSVKIKHHPRQRNLKKWRNIQNKYSNIEEIKHSLNDVNDKYSFCLTLFSSAPLFLLSRGVPVFEFSPYKKYTDYGVKLHYHYKGEDNSLMHDMLEHHLYEKIEVDNITEEYINKEKLRQLSTFQYEQCKDVFPGDANLSIVNKLVDLASEKC